MCDDETGDSSYASSWTGTSRVTHLLPVQESTQWSTNDDAACDLRSMRFVIRSIKQRCSTQRSLPRMLISRDLSDGPQLHSRLQLRRCTWAGGGRGHKNRRHALTVNSQRAGGGCSLLMDGEWTGIVHRFVRVRTRCVAYYLICRSWLWVGHCHFASLEIKPV